MSTRPVTREMLIGIVPEFADILQRDAEFLGAVQLYLAAETQEERGVRYMGAWVADRVLRDGEQISTDQFHADVLEAKQFIEGPDFSDYITRFAN